ncbi:hypothetical protein NA57DRAFT_35010 [Rhizodiscina lignyota]|uniref:Arrestin C-terminal-like domain-containing protein n=1 Tax=Rhizodiscina lignyota TaxID=1504668 RepID=A0A9P4MBY3_9PEZI|nr:hypothetical protein NA57DRAFT_35010 [Rhizodiscina lignyota]
MEKSTYGSLQSHTTSAPPWSTSGIPPWSTATRPLSDIRELTEPSLVDMTNRKPSVRRQLSKKSSASHTRNVSLARKDSVTAAFEKPHSLYKADRTGRQSPIASPSTPGDRSSIYSIPPGNVPPRSSSRPRRQRSTSQSRGPIPDPPPREQAYTIRNRGQSRSPVKEYAARFDPVSFESIRHVPSRTFIRNPQPVDILDAPSHRHPRISADLHISASLFVGGGSIEGHVKINVDDAERLRHKRALALGRVSVDLLGVEEMAWPKRVVFLNLATELVDSENPPPHNMVESLKHISPIDPFWLLTPSISSIPFMLSLPLDVGPPPFQSKNARIRYVLCVTLLVRDQGRLYLVRSSQDVSVLSVYDPEKALMSLPSPLTASDEYIRHRESSIETIRVTAGLHRQVWVSGTNIFVDVHIANHSRKVIKRVELQLERDILCYKHAAAATLEKSASQARIFDSNERIILTKVAFKQGVGNWNGVPAHSTDVRTYDLELPRGHATVKCGKYFEVRYFLNITIGTTHTKLVTVQLPIVLIHMNSLDVVPNSVAQVAAAIEEKRATAFQQQSQNGHSPRQTANTSLARRPSLSVQGRAFAAPRMQSMERTYAEAEDFAQLGQILDSTPRRYVPNPQQQQQHQMRRVASSFEYHTPPSNRKGRVLGDEEKDEIRRHLRHVASNETNRTAFSASKLRSNGPSRMNSKASRRPAGGASSAPGFREAEVEEEVGIGALGLRQSSSAAGSYKSKFEGSRARNFQFPHLGRTRSKSRDRWKGWFGESQKEKSGWI